MAKMIPDDVQHGDFHGSLGEETVYNALRTLPKEYIVFHSVQWQKKNAGGYVSWGESDFAVFHPKRGLLIIEVKSGGIRYNNGQWTQINTLTGSEYSMKDPLVQAQRSKYTFVDLLEHVKGPLHSYWIEVAVWFPSIESKKSIGELPPAYKPEIVLAQEDLSWPVGSIEKIFDYYNMCAQSFYCQDDANWVINTLSPNYDAVPGISYTISEQDFAFNRMTSEQSALLDYLEEQRAAAIQGGAGTGKTMLAVEKAKRLSMNDRVLFLCFNRFLLNFLKATYSQNSQIEFFNLPALSCSKMGRSNVGDNDTITAYLNAFDSYDWNYKHIIIDEGQDFLSEHIAILSAIAEIQGGCFYVFYDKNQLVQQWQALEWINMMDCRLVLTANCRNTKSIASTSYRPIGIEQIKMKSEVLGVKPNLFIEVNKIAALDRIAKLIRHYTDNGLTQKDIVILTVKTEDTSLLSNVSTVGSYRLTKEIGASGVLFTSSRKFKGLESPVVIMIDMDDSTFISDEARRVLYVGTSRAKHFLDFVCVLDDYQLATIAECLTGKKAKAARLTIAAQLKVKIIAEPTQQIT